MKYPIWKPLLLMVVVLGCGAMLWLKGLNPGIDLAGGTTLTYAVQVPDGQNAETAIEQTIEILKDRVDPAGIMNLVWRAEVGDRLSVQMALAPPEVAEKREAYEKAVKALVAENLPAQQISAALARPGELRLARLAEIKETHPQIAEELDRLSVLADRQDAATEVYREALEAYQSVADNVEGEPSEAEAEQLESLRGDLDRVTVEALNARDAFETGLGELLANNLTKAEFARVIELSDETGKAGAASPRARALLELKETHPARADAIETAAAAWKVYEKDKGQLDDPNDLIRMLRGAGVLEFRIAATPGERPVDAQRYIDRLREQGPKAGRSEPWRWFEVESLADYLDSPRFRAIVEDDPTTTGQVFAQQLNVVGQHYGGSYYVLLANTPDLSLTDQEQWELAGAVVQPDQQGLPSVGFTLDPSGGALMGAMTGPNVGKPMAIVLDGKVMSSPNLLDRIGSRGQITGRFSAPEARALVQTLKAGSLSSTLSYDPISIKTTGPQLGQDNLKAGVSASVIAVCTVAAFMVVYYFGAGLVAVVALAGNMLIILGVMSLTSATFTLPGIAGLVLTIGMAVDANVLIFERIREEVRAGVNDLKTAVRVGFGKALSSILDANITTLLTCLVLYYTATSEIKGFAVVLSIGIVATLFTTLFGSRVLIDLALAYGNAKRLPMLPTAVPAVERLLEPSINWFALRKFFIPLSLVIIVAGGFMIYERGEDLLDIEFRSGTEVTFSFADGQTLSLEAARDRLEAYAQSPTQDADDIDWSHLADATVVTVGEVTDNGATGFSVATLIEDADAVSQAVKDAFGDLLDTTRPIGFRGEDLDLSAAAGLVERINSADLGKVIGDPLASGDLGEFRGGVAIVLDELNPPASVEDIRSRIDRMQNQPDYADLGYRNVEVIGLDVAGSNDAGETTYGRVVVAAEDESTNYVDDPDQFGVAGGLADTQWQLVKEALQQDTSLDSVSNFSSQVSGTMQQRAIVAMLLSMLVVVAYIALRFGSFRYGAAAIVALMHDVAAAVGLLAICNWLYDSGMGHALLLDDFKVNLAIVAAVLTLIGYSLNDTIIVFDRIRENKGRLPEPTAEIINNSINQTISRTVLTSGTTLIAVLVLYLFGGPGVHGFAFTMMIGVFVGTYSSFAIAAPLLVLGKRQPPSKPAKTAPAVSEKATADDELPEPVAARAEPTP